MSLSVIKVKKNLLAKYLNPQVLFTFFLLVLLPGTILLISVLSYSVFWSILILITIIGVSLTYKKCQNIHLADHIRMEKEIMRLEQLNIIGQMSAGIGHEVRNALTTVHGFLQILRNKEQDNKNKDYYEIMISEMERANNIISEFLVFANTRPVKFEKQNLNKLIEKMYPLIQSLALENDKDVHLDLHETPEILLNENEIRQMLLNLVTNGLEAIDPGEYVLISTHMCDGKIQMSIKDQGKGIPPEILKKLGTPFMTTKSNGTGLGITICYKIAAHHNAKILIDTGSAGTVINIVFDAIK